MPRYKIPSSFAIATAAVVEDTFIFSFSEARCSQKSDGRNDEGGWGDRDESGGGDEVAVKHRDAAL